MRGLLTMLLSLAAAAPAAAGPWHEPSNHLALWSPVDETATGAVIARELALAPGDVRRSLRAGQDAATWDHQAGARDDPALKAPVDGHYLKEGKLRVAQTEAGFDIQVDADKGFSTVVERARPPVYVAEVDETAVVWDGEELCAARYREGGYYQVGTAFVSESAGSRSACVPLARWLPDDGDYRVGVADEMIVYGTAELDAPKIYALPVAEDGTLDPGRRGLVLAIGGAEDRDALGFLAAWVRTDLEPPTWREVSAGSNPSAKYSAVASIPPVQLYRIRNRYLDANLDLGLGVDDGTEADFFPALIGGSVNWGSKYLSAELISRPGMAGLAGWVHTRRRYPFEAAFGILPLSHWKGRISVFAAGVRLGVPLLYFVKTDVEVIVAGSEFSYSLRATFVDWDVYRPRYFTAGLVLRGTSYQTGIPESPDGLRGWIGITGHFSTRLTTVHAR